MLPVPRAQVAAFDRQHHGSAVAVTVNAHAILDAMRDYSPDGRHYPPWLMADLVDQCFKTLSLRLARAGALGSEHRPASVANGKVVSTSFFANVPIRSDVRATDSVYALCVSTYERFVPRGNIMRAGVFRLEMRCQVAGAFTCK
eukprot:6220651-Prymnesium_polylepis.1